MFQIEFIKGPDNIFADIFSRFPPISETEVETLHCNVIEIINEYDDYEDSEPWVEEHRVIIKSLHNDMVGHAGRDVTWDRLKIIRPHKRWRGCAPVNWQGCTWQ